MRGFIDKNASKSDPLCGMSVAPELDPSLLGQHGRECATAPLRGERAVLEWVLIDETVEGLCECARDFAWSPGTRPIHQACHALVGKALHPFAAGRIGKGASGGDRMDMVPSDDRTDGLGAAQDTGFPGLLEHGVSGGQRINAKMAFEGTHHSAPGGSGYLPNT